MCQKNKHIISMTYIFIEFKNRIVAPKKNKIIFLRLNLVQKGRVYEIILIAKHLVEENLM